MSNRDPFTRYRERLAALGFRPSSSLGQNFLIEESLHRWIVAAAAPTTTDTAVEVGVGLGFLTRELAAAAGRVVAVEIDARLLAIAREDLADCQNIEWVAGDALAGPSRSLHPAIQAALATAAAPGLLVANLPYAVAGPLLAAIAALPVLPRRAVLLVQRELAQRVVAGVGSPDYGNLSAYLQCLFRPSLLRQVSPQVFRPRPKVWSAILQLDAVPAPPPLATAAARLAFGAFLRQLFQQRRKLLRTTLPQAAASQGLAVPAQPPELLARRAEELAPPQLLELWSGLFT